MSILYTNCKVYTMGTEEGYSAFLVKDGKIEALYTPEQTLPDVKTVVDLGGKTVLPSLTDSHMHFMMSVHYAGYLSLLNVANGKVYPSNFEELCKVLAGFTASKSKDEPVLAYCYVPSATEEQRLPTRYELDRFTDGATISIITIDGHASAHSSKMLKLLEFEELAPDGVMSGLVHEHNIYKLNTLLSEQTRPEDAERNLVSFVNKTIALGITCCCCLEGFSNESDPALDEFVKIAGRLPLDLRLFPQLTSFEAVEKYLPAMRQKRIGGCGLWEIDGSVGAHSAAFTEPFLGEDEPKPTYFDQATFDGMIRKANDGGYQTTTHAIGTAACEMALLAYEKCTAKGNPLRHRIDHFEFTTKDQAQRAANLGLYVAAQPGYAWYDKLYLHSYKNFLPAAAVRRQLPLSVLAQSGLLLGSSDSPVQDVNPYTQMQGMVEFPLPQYRLSLYEAFKTYTVYPAAALGELNERGTLDAGKRADFIVFDEDPFDQPLNKVYELRPSATYIDGKQYQPMTGGGMESLLSLLKKNKKI